MGIYIKYIDRIHIIESSMQDTYLPKRHIIEPSLRDLTTYTQDPPGGQNPNVEILFTKAVFLVTSNTMAVFPNQDNRVYYTPGRQVYNSLLSSIAKNRYLYNGQWYATHVFVI